MIVQVLKDESITDSTVFMLDIGGENSDSSIYFGGVDETKIPPEQAIDWHDLTSDYSWEVEFTGLGIGESTPIVLASTKAYFSSSFDFILLPTSIFDSFVTMF